MLRGRVFVSHSYYCHKLRFPPLSLSLILCAATWERLRKFGETLWHWASWFMCGTSTGSVQWLDTSIYMLSFFLPKLCPQPQSVTVSLPLSPFSLYIFAYACLLPSFRLKKVIYFTLTLTSTLFTPSTFCPPISVPSPSHYHYQLLRLPWRHRKLMMILIDAFALLWPCFTFSLHVFLRI